MDCSGSVSQYLKCAPRIPNKQPKDIMQKVVGRTLSHGIMLLLLIGMAQCRIFARLLSEAVDVLL
jgi:hypothetical protein